MPAEGRVHAQGWLASKIVCTAARNALAVLITADDDVAGEGTSSTVGSAWLGTDVGAVRVSDLGGSQASHNTHGEDSHGGGLNMLRVDWYSGDRCW